MNVYSAPGPGARRIIAVYPAVKASMSRPRPAKSSGRASRPLSAYAPGTTAVTTVSGVAAASARRTTDAPPRRLAAGVGGEGTAPLETPGGGRTTCCDHQITDSEKIGTPYGSM